jgi:hypothetical protein
MIDILIVQAVILKEILLIPEVLCVLNAL